MAQPPCANLSTARKWYGHGMLSKEVFASAPRSPGYRAPSPSFSQAEPPARGTYTDGGNGPALAPRATYSTAPEQGGQFRNLRGPTRSAVDQFFLAELWEG